MHAEGGCTRAFPHGCHTEFLCLGSNHVVFPAHRKETQVQFALAFCAPAVGMRPLAEENVVWSKPSLLTAYDITHQNPEDYPRKSVQFICCSSFMGVRKNMIYGNALSFSISWCSNAHNMFSSLPIIWVLMQQPHNRKSREGGWLNAESAQAFCGHQWPSTLYTLYII